MSFYASFVRSLKKDSILTVRLLTFSVFHVAFQILTYLVYTFFTIRIRLGNGLHAVSAGLGYGLDNGEILVRFSPKSRGFSLLSDA
jgi:hypothetical protein